MLGKVFFHYGLQKLIKYVEINTNLYRGNFIFHFNLTSLRSNLQSCILFATLFQVK